MDNNCQLVVFSDKAYNAIISETFKWDPVETGGILLGHILDNGCWIVMEVLPPGYGEGREGDNVYHEYGYFEYNKTFVNYLAKSVADQYEIPLELLGLWHRHPGSMDHFSGTDDGTNTTYASQNPHGVISGLVNIDPQLRLTMYYLAHETARSFGRPHYQQVDVEVGSDLIPENYFKLKYYQGSERDLHPYAPQRKPQLKASEQNQNNSDTLLYGQNANSTTSKGNTIDTKDIVNRQLHQNSQQTEVTANNEVNTDHITTGADLIERLKKNKIKLAIILMALIVFIFSLSSIKNDLGKVLQIFNHEDSYPEVQMEINSVELQDNKDKDTDESIDNSQIDKTTDKDNIKPEVTPTSKKDESCIVKDKSEKESKESKTKK